MIHIISKNVVFLPASLSLTSPGGIPLGSEYRGNHNRPSSSLCHHEASFHTIFLSIFCLWSAAEAFAASATIDRIWLEHNVSQDGQTGLRIHLKFTVWDMQGQQGEAITYFESPKGVGVKDLDRRYYTTDGNVPPANVSPLRIRERSTATLSFSFLTKNSTCSPDRTPTTVRYACSTPRTTTLPTVTTPNSKFTWKTERTFPDPPKTTAPSAFGSATDRTEPIAVPPLPAASNRFSSGTAQ